MGSWPLTCPGQHLELLLHFRILGKHINHRLSGCFLSLWTDLDIEDPSFLVVNGSDQSLSSPLGFNSGCVSLEDPPGQEELVFYVEFETWLFCFFSFVKSTPPSNVL